MNPRRLSSISKTSSQRNRACFLGISAIVRCSGAWCGRRIIISAGHWQRLLDVVLFTPRKHWSQERIDTACAEIKKELAMWETMIRGDYLFGTLSAVDFTLYPQSRAAATHRPAKPDPFAW